MRTEKVQIERRSRVELAWAGVRCGLCGRWLGLEEGFSFPVGDEITEARVGVRVGLLVSRLPELVGEEVKCRLGVVGIFADYEYMCDSPTPHRKPLSKHLQKVSFPGLPADDQDFCDGGEQFLKVRAMTRRPFKGVR